MTNFSVVDTRLRPFGVTGLMLPSLSVGTAALGRPAYLNLDHAKEISDASVDGMRALTHDVLDAAYAGGVRHFDTARSYGLAETFLSDWLGRNAYSDVVVTSKWGYRYVGDWQIGNFPHEIKDLSVQAFAEQSQETVQEFGNLLTGYQIHSATIDSGVLEDKKVLQALKSFAESGFLIGVSTSGPGQAATIRAVLELSASGEVPFSFVQATWNILETSATAALEDAANSGLGIIVKEALANGRLVKEAGVPPQVLELARKYGVGPDAICLAAAAALSCRPVVLCGPVSVGQLLDNLKANTINLSEDELAELSSLSEDAAVYWSIRSSLPWT